MTYTALDSIKKTLRGASMASMPLMLMLLTLLASCSKSHEAEVLDLLGNVPADAEFVAVANLSEMVSQSGGKVKDGKVVDAKNLLKVLNYDNDEPKLANFMLSEDSGVDCSSAVVFSSKGDIFFNMLLTDADAFRAGYDKINPGEWTKGEEGLLYKDDIAIKGDRLWGADRRLNPAQIAGFSELSEVESFRSSKYAETLSKSEDAISIWASVDGLMNVSNVTFSHRATMKMALGMFFKDPRYLAANMNFKDHALKSELQLLDGDFKPAKCELALSEISGDVVSSLGGNANTVLALAVSEKLIKQLTDLASSLGGALPPAYLTMLSPLDGTLAVATASESLSAANFGKAGFRAVITTNGRENAALAQALQALGDVKINGKTFNISKGSYGNGEMPLADVAKSFKGAWFGAAAAVDSSKVPFSKMTFLLTPASGSVKASLTMQFK